MNSNTYLKVLSHYHLWAYEALFKSMDQLSQTQYFNSCGLFFDSLHGTLNHLYLADSVWYCRFTQTEHHFKSLKDISFDHYITGKKMITERCQNWIDYIETLKTPLPQTITTKNFAGKSRQSSFLVTLMHVFNHGTHHRGQMSAALTQLGLKAPIMDLIYYHSLHPEINQ